MNVLVTGATGFVGARILEAISSTKALKPIAAIRRTNIHTPFAAKVVCVDELGPNTDWNQALIDVHVVIHTAARVHVMNDKAADVLSEFRRINTEGTLRLARLAVKAGVKRFIFLSSIKVNGESTSLSHPFTSDDNPNPVDPYGISKHETESGLLDIANKSNMEVVIIRPPLVYGAGVKANFKNMMKWLYIGVPLPFGAIKNKRSLVALDNLVDLIMKCIVHPAAANQIFLVSDDDDLSTSELMRHISTSMGLPSRIFSVHQKLIEISLNLIGKKSLAQRLCGSLIVDISKTRNLLNWNPPLSVGEAITKTTDEYLIQVNRSKARKLNVRKSEQHK